MALNSSKSAPRKIRADRQAVQRGWSVLPVCIGFRLVPSVAYGGCLNGAAQPSRSFIQAPAIVPKLNGHAFSLEKLSIFCYSINVDFRIEVS